MTSYPPPPPGGAQPPPYGAPTPPPPTPDTSVAVKVPPVAWLIPVAALLALVGLFTPWFKAKATASAGGKTIHHTFDGLYSFKDGKLGLLAPILLVILAAGVIGLLIGKSPARFSKGGAHPVASAGKASIVVGVVSLICVVIAWFLVKSQYRFKEGGKEYGWDAYIKLFKQSGIKLELSKGPQIGYFVTIAAALLAIVAGTMMWLASRSAANSPAAGGAAAGGYGTPPAGAGYSTPPAPGGYGTPPAPGGYAPPPTGYPQGPPRRRSTSAALAQN